MSDLKTPWQSGGFYANEENNPGMPMDVGLSGDIALDRGGDPLYPDGQKETPNNVSGLPTLPHRFVESGEPPAPPTLEDRNPGTIDQPTRSKGGVQQ